LFFDSKKSKLINSQITSLDCGDDYEGEDFELMEKSRHSPKVCINSDEDDFDM